MDEVKVTIIGAGVVGLAIAAELSARVQDIVVLEQHDSFGKPAAGTAKSFIRGFIIRRAH